MEENKIPTVEGFFMQELNANATGGGELIEFEYALEKAIEFAKLHVKAALEIASEVPIKVEKKSQWGKYRKWQKVRDGEEFDLFQFHMKSSQDKKSILTAYSLDNIK